MIYETNAHRRTVCFALMMLLTVAPLTYAVETVQLDLNEALQLTLENDLGIQLAQLEVEERKVQLEQAEAGNLLEPSPTLLFQAEVGLELARRSRDIEERSILLRVEEEYYTLLRLENIIEVLDEAIKLAERQLEVAKKRLESGAATTLDVMKAETALEEHKDDKAQAEENLQLARHKFLQSLGLPSDTKVVLDSDVITQTLPDISLEEAIGEGMQNRIELRQAAAGVSIAEKELELATNDYTPVLTKRAAEIELEQAKLQQLQAEQGIQLDIEKTYHDMHVAYRAMALAERQLEEAEENYRVVQTLFEAGMATDVEILQVQTGFMQAKSARVDAIFDFNTARANLFSAIGWNLADRDE